MTPATASDSAPRRWGRTALLTLLATLSMAAVAESIDIGTIRVTPPEGFIPNGNAARPGWFNVACRIGLVEVGDDFASVWRRATAASSRSSALSDAEMPETRRGQLANGLEFESAVLTRPPMPRTVDYFEVAILGHPGSAQGFYVLGTAEPCESAFANFMSAITPSGTAAVDAILAAGKREQLLYEQNRRAADLAYQQQRERNQAELRRQQNMWKPIR